VIHAPMQVASKKFNAFVRTCSFLVSFVLYTPKVLRICLMMPCCVVLSSRLCTLPFHRKIVDLVSPGTLAPLCGIGLVKGAEVLLQLLLGLLGHAVAVGMTRIR